MSYDESIRIDDMILRDSAILLPRMVDGLEPGRRIGDLIDVPKSIADARVRLIRDERKREEHWSSGRIVVGLEMTSKPVRIGEHLKERHGYELPEGGRAVAAKPSFPAARGEAVELAVAIMDWWDAPNAGHGIARPVFVDIAERILGR